jgi:hypothetical protein
MRSNSLVRRCLAVLAAVLLVGALSAITFSAPANANSGGDGIALSIVSVTDRGTKLPGPVKYRPFDVTVKVVDSEGRLTTVSETTVVVLKEVFGRGVLFGNTVAVIPANGSSATIYGAKYSKYANGVVLGVYAFYGADLKPDKIKVDVALTAVSAFAIPGEPLKLIDPNCVAPTPKVPTCGKLILKNGAKGRVILAIHSCKGLEKKGGIPCRERDDIQALVVTVIANLKDREGDPLYSRKDPAIVVVICDKVLCGKSKHSEYKYSDHVPKIPLIYTLKNTGPLTNVAPPCPKKGVIGKGQQVCTDFAKSFVRKGDLYTYGLFKLDPRFSHP